MGYKYVISIDVQCDDCGHAITVPNDVDWGAQQPKHLLKDIDIARYVLAHHGWKFIEGKDYCRKCSTSKGDSEILLPLNSHVDEEERRSTLISNKRRKYCLY